MAIGIRPTYLPPEIIEIILSRLPVKSLLRFTCVCKQWNATISHPKFAETHLRQPKHSSPDSPPPTFLHDGLCTSPRTAQLVGFENDKFRQLSRLQLPPMEELDTIRLLCHCDGLYLIMYFERKTREYALWNPSRRSYKKLNQDTFDFNHCDFICGICYDPLLKDYKVVFGDANHYAVFYCRRNSWSGLREMNRNMIRHGDKVGVPFNGSIYCIRYSNQDEIVYFDGSDEKFKSLRKLDGDAQLISSGDCLYLFHYIDTKFMMKKVGEEWMELKVEWPEAVNRDWVWPVCCTHQNQILLSYAESKYLVYDVSKRAMARVDEDGWNSVFRSRRLFPYVENLFW